MASVLIGDLDDFIGPSQACVNPIFAGPGPNSGSGGQQQQNGGTAAAGDAGGTTEAQDKGRAKVTLEASWAMDDGFAVGAPVATEEVRPDLIKSKGPGAAATVSLNDCLACSGCVTSAETVLISRQSGGEFLRVLHRQSSEHRHIKAVAIALAPQTLASLAVRLSSAAAAAASAPPSPAHIQRCLQRFFRQLAAAAAAPGAGAAEPLPVYVYGTSAASHVAVVEAAAEFIARFRHSQQHQEQRAASAPAPMTLGIETGPATAAQPTAGTAAWTSPPPSRALSATADDTGPAPAPRHEALPMLASACPGWVCYAEKTTPQALPYMATTKSPQQILGSLVKGVLAPNSGLQPREVFLVGVMPCYDKKLEASRKDFYHEESEWGGTAEVDLVLSTGEVLDMILQQHQLDGPSMAPGGEGEAAATAAFLALDGTDAGAGATDMDVDATATSASNGDGARPTLASAEAALLSGLDPSSPEHLAGPVAGPEAGSGGFLEYVFRAAARELFGVSIPAASPLPYVQGRNQDYQEVTLEVGGQPVLRFALAYGFRNIQAVVGKLRRGKCPLHFVEVMACPSGCVNGGGQVKGPPGEPSAAAKERVGAVRAALGDGRRAVAPEQADAAQWVYSAVAPHGPLGPEALSLFHTRYHTVPKLELSNPSVIKW